VQPFGDSVVAFAFGHLCIAPYGERELVQLVGREADAD